MGKYKELNFEQYYTIVIANYTTSCYNLKNKRDISKDQTYFDVYRLLFGRGSVCFY